MFKENEWEIGNFFNEAILNHEILKFFTARWIYKGHSGLG